jgi:four helix bundle protein
MKTKRYRDLKVWQKAMELARKTYQATQSFPKQEMFSLTGQIRRAAVSIPSNIAEGQGRTTDRAFVVFLGHSRGSLYELETQIELAATLGYLENEKAEELLTDCAEVGRMLNGLLSALREEDD